MKGPRWAFWVLDTLSHVVNHLLPSAAPPGLSCFPQQHELGRNLRDICGGFAATEEVHWGLFTM